MNNKDLGKYSKVWKKLFQKGCFGKTLIERWSIKKCLTCQYFKECSKETRKRYVNLHTLRGELKVERY